MSLIRDALGMKSSSSLYFFNINQLPTLRGQRRVEDIIMKL